MHTLGTHRYLVLAEARFGRQTSKTANSAVRYLPDRVLGIIDSTQAGRTVEDVLGFGGAIPILSRMEEGLGRAPNALLIGIAPTGGRLPQSWRPAVETALDAGLDVVSGLHFALADDPDLSARAHRNGVKLWDLRREPENLPVASGLARNIEAFSVLTVGTDCNIGKMTASLQIREALVERGSRAGFAATGQTGILIEGWGTAVDAVKADFIAGAAEQLVMKAAETSDIVLIEGQGSLVHPGYSGVTLGLLHGAMPDAMILCHQPTRTHVFSSDGACAWVPLQSLPEAIRIYESAIAPLRPARVIGISLNTYDLSESESRAAMERAQRETGLPATDPVRFGAGPLAEVILEGRQQKLGKVA